MNKKFLFVALIAALLFAGVSLLVKRTPGPSDTGRLDVVTSFYPLYYFASQVGGDKAAVWDVTPAGAEPHDYEPTAEDMVKIENSSLLILNGGGLEAWGHNVRQNVNPGKTTVVVAGDGLTSRKVTEEGRAMVDPHVWLSPPLAEKMVDRIAQGFIKADPRDKDYYEANAERLKSRLRKLDAEYRQGLKSCKVRDIITSHAAFGYMASAYGLKQVSIAGLSPDAEPSPLKMADIVNFAKKHNIKYIFFEKLVSPKLSRTIATEVGAKTLVLNPIEGLSDKELAEGKDYFTVMRSNLKDLRTALQCR